MNMNKKSPAEGGAFFIHIGPATIQLKLLSR
jgi:hypothetical protein